MPRRLAAVLIVASLAFGALLAAGLVLLLRDSDDEHGALATMSAGERPVTIAVPERIGPPNSPRLTGEALLIGERAGFRFVRLPREDGSSCFAYSELRSGDWQLLGFKCETGFQRFPDPAQPVMTVRGLEAIPDTQILVHNAVAGFAADGIKRIAVIDAQDRVVPIAEVVDNTFYSDGQGDQVKALVALDEADEVIWRLAAPELPDE
jgi:hypothetical protein